MAKNWVELHTSPKTLGYATKKQLSTIDHVGKNWANWCNEEAIKHIDHMDKTCVGWRFKLSN
jgi:hypothetical protein